MMDHTALIARLQTQLKTASSATLAQSLQRYFPPRFTALGVSNAIVVAIAKQALASNPALGCDEWLTAADLFARSHAQHEYFILASALVANVAGRLDDEGRLLDRLQAWLENDVSNWAQCDDLCIKPMYLYLKRRPQLLRQIPAWGASDSPWCRRASNVALVKFVGRHEDCDLGQVLANCETLLVDGDPYVQKGIGWMLKVASQREPERVLGFLRQHSAAMSRPTLRYAIEKLPAELRQPFLLGIQRKELAYAWPK